MKAKQRKLQKQSLIQSSNANVSGTTSKEPSLLALTTDDFKSQVSSSKVHFDGPISKLIDNDIKKYSQHQPQQKRQFKKSSRELLKKESSKIETPTTNEDLEELVKTFNIDIEHDRIKIEENNEYYDMRVEINELQNSIKNSKKQYEMLIEQNQKKINEENKQIMILENRLKQKLEENVEEIKKDNHLCEQEINVLEGKLEKLKQEQIKEDENYEEMTKELDNTNKRLEEEMEYINKIKHLLLKFNNKY